MFLVARIWLAVLAAVLLFWIGLVNPVSAITSPVFTTEPCVFVTDAAFLYTDKISSLWRMITTYPFLGDQSENIMVPAAIAFMGVFLPKASVTAKCLFLGLYFSITEMMSLKFLKNFVLL
jgi:hypothetical protein